MTDPINNQLDHNRKLVVNNEYTRLKEKHAILQAEYMLLFNEKQVFVARYSQYWLDLGSSKKYNEIYAYYKYLIRVFEQGQIAIEKDHEKAKDHFFDDSFDDETDEITIIEDSPFSRKDSPRKLKVKEMYKKAARLCHPDKLPESLKDRGQEIFVELSVAYRNADYQRVKEIYDALSNSGFSKLKVQSTTALEDLNEQIMKLELLIHQTKMEIKKFQNSSYYKAVFSGQFPDFEALYYSIKYMRDGIDKLGNIKTYKKKHYAKYMFKRP